MLPPKIIIILSVLFALESKHVYCKEIVRGLNLLKMKKTLRISSKDDHKLGVLCMIYYANCAERCSFGVQLVQAVQIRR